MFSCFTRIGVSCLTFRQNSGKFLGSYVFTKLISLCLQMLQKAVNMVSICCRMMTSDRQGHHESPVFSNELSSFN